MSYGEFAGLLARDRDERRRRAIALAEARDAQPGGGRRAEHGGRRRRAGGRGRMRQRRTDGPLEFGDEIIGAAALARDVVADVHDAWRTRRGREQRVER